jgi:hypothetical protein
MDILSGRASEKGLGRLFTMSSSLKSLGRMFLAAAAVMVLSSGAANAAFISDLSAVYGVEAVNDTQFILTPSVLEQSVGPLPPPVNFSDVIVDVSAFTGSPGQVSLFPNFTVNTGLGDAVFAFVNPALLIEVNAANPPAGAITGVLQLLSSTLPAEFEFASAYDFSFSYTGIEINSDGTYTFSNLPGASFSATAQDEIPPIPEPTSLVVMSVLGMTGYFARRKLGTK